MGKWKHRSVPETPKSKRNKFNTCRNFAQEKKEQLASLCSLTDKPVVHAQFISLWSWRALVALSTLGLSRNLF